MSGSWYYWTGDTTSTTTTSTDDGCWTVWNTSDTTSISNTWIVWAGDTSGSITVDSTLTIYNCVIWGNWIGELTTPQEMAGQQEEQRRLAQEAQRKRTEQQKAAEVTAQELLEDLLTEKEVQIYRETGRVLVKGSKYNYLIRKDTGWIRRVGKDKAQDFCMHIEDRHNFVPTDNVISMKLFLEAREEQFLKEANPQGFCELDQDDQKCLLAMGQ